MSLQLNLATRQHTASGSRRLSPTRLPR